MAAKPTRTSISGSDLRVRLASVRAGIAVTLVVCVAAAVETSLFERSDRRYALLAVLGVAAVLGLAVGLLPWERIVASRFREAAFLTWSFSNVATITVFALVAGTPNSATSLMFLVPIVFVSMSYPLRSVLLVGSVALASYLAQAAATASTPDFVVMFSAVLASTAMMGAWQARNHDRVNDALELASRTDPLTGCFNRRGFEAAAQAALASGARVAVFLADLDAFKQINDTRGHAAGDVILKRTADALATAIGEHGSVGRIGGDEFGVLLSPVDDAAMRLAGERLGQALAAVTPGSIGAAVSPEDGTALDDLLLAADRHLYRAKLRRASDTASPAGTATA